MVKYTGYIFVFLLLLQNNTAAADTTATSVGVYFNYNIHFHSAEFGELPGVPNCCPRFGNTSGRGIAIGGFYEQPLTEKVNITVRGGFSFINAAFEAEEMSLVGVGGEPADALIKHELNAGIAHFVIEPLAKYNIAGRLNLIAGMNFGIGIASSYDQREILTKPEKGTFENGLRTRNIRSGSINGISLFSPSLVVGASCVLPVNLYENIYLSPEIMFNLGIGRLVSGADWKTASLRLGISAGYRFKAPEDSPPFQKRQVRDIDTLFKESENITLPFVNQGFPSIKIDTLYREDRRLITELYRRTDTLFKPVTYFFNPSVTAIPTDGVKDYPDTTMLVEEMAILSFVPVLNYIFFPDNSPEIPNRYKLLSSEQADMFIPENISQSGTLNVYYNLLNTIGYRLRNNPDAKLTVTGCNSNKGNEKNNKSLSKSRAESVADYFINVWRIEPSRIKTEAQNLPDNASSMELPEGVEENQRVELTSNNPEILMPQISDDTARAVFPGKIKFAVKTDYPDKVSSWNLVAMINGQPLREFHGEGKLPESILWNINDEKSSIPEADGDIVYFLEVKDKRGASNRSRLGALPQTRYFLRKHIGSKVFDKKVENFSLILFEFDTKRTNATNRRILDFIISRLDKDSKVIIEGYTDNLGGADYNKKLSEDRARSVSKYIDLKDAEVKGYGNSSPFYDNKLPEGRFYNRTVIIIVETPIIKGD